MAEIDRLEIALEADSKKVDKALDSLVNSLSKVQKDMKGLQGLTNKNSKQFQNFSSNVQKLGKNMKGLHTVVNSTGKDLKNFSNNTKNLGKNISVGSGSVKQFAFSAGKLYAAVQIVKKAFDGLGASVKASMDYIETYNYFMEAFGQVASKADLSDWQELGYKTAEEYYNSFAERAKELTRKMSGFDIAADGALTMGNGKSLGIDPNQVMQYQAVFGQMSSSIGLASETALKLSDVLTQIGADLASVKNMDFSKVWNDMQSGLAGMSRTMDKYGVNIRNVNLQQKLNELGIKANIQALNQNDKALLRSIIILDSTRYAWGDLSETINAPANQLRLLQANFTNLARTIGNLFLPIIAKIIPYINAAVMGLTKMVEYIAKVFGIKMTDWGGSMSGASDAMSDILDETENEAGALDNAAKNAKKLKQQLQGFDELNVLSSNSEDALGGLSSGVTNATGALESALDKILEEYENAWNDAYDNMNLKSTNILGALQTKAKEIGGAFTLGFDTANVSTKGAELVEKWRGIVGQIKGIFSDEGVTNAINNMGTSAITAVGSIAGSITSLLTSFGFGVAGGTEQALTESETFIKGKVTSIANNITSLNTKITSFSTAVAKIGTAFESESFQKIVAFFEKLVGYIVLEAWDKFTGVVSDLFGIFTKPISDNATKWKTLLENVFDIVSKLFTPFDNLIDLLMDNSKDYEDSFLHDVLSGIGDFASKKIGEKIDEVNKNLEKFSGYLDDIKEAWDALTSDDEKEFTLEGTFKLGTTALDIAEMWNNLQGWWGKRSLVASVVIDALQNFAEWIKNTWEILKTKWGTKNLNVGLIFDSGISEFWENFKKNWNSGDKKEVPVGTKPKNTKKTVKSMWSGVKKAWNASDKNLSINTIAKLASGAVASMQKEVDKTPLTLHANVEFKIENGKRLNWDAGLQKWFYYDNGQKIYVKKEGGAFYNGKWKPIAQYAGGGIPSHGTLFTAGEAGPEIVGHVGGRTEVLNQSQLAATMYASVQNANAQTNALLAKQNELLERILEKEVGISSYDIFKSVRNSAKDYHNRTGRGAFAY